MIESAVSIFTDICRYAVPFTIVFNLGTIVVRTLLNFMLGGRADL